LVRKFEGERPFGRQNCIWDYNIKTKLRKIVLEDVAFIHVAQDREQ
jgi:hypothetical protein